MTVATILAAKGRHIVTAEPHHSLQEAARLLAERRIGAVLIAAPDGSLKGILSERDIVRAIALRGAAALDDKVEAHMTRNVVTCTEASLIAEVMEEMTKGRFRHLPVVKDGKLAGMVSIGDVVKQRIAEAEAESRSLRDYIQMAS
jgi:CBS domain-containing protein